MRGFITKVFDGPFEIFSRTLARIRADFCADPRSRVRARRIVVDAAAAVTFRQLSITANTVAAFMQHPDPTTFGPEAVRPSGRKKKEKKTRAYCKLHRRHLLHVFGNCSYEFPCIRASYRLYISIYRNTVKIK